MSASGSLQHPEAVAAFGRVSTAMITPFTADGALDLETAQKVAKHLVSLGHDGLVLSGTTGESPTTDDGEKAELLRAVREAVGPEIRLVTGVGTNDTRHSTRLAARAAADGADGVLIVTPYYSKPSQAGIAAHVRAVAEAAELPAMVYDIPGRSAVPIHSETLIDLGEHPLVLAVKDAKGDLDATTQVMAETDLAYYSGEDALNLPLLAIGAVGVVSVVGHLLGARYRAMIEAVDAGDLTTARQIHLAARPLVATVMTRIPGAVAAKAALELQGVIPNRSMRLPLLGADDDFLADLREAMTRTGLL